MRDASRVSCLRLSAGRWVRRPLVTCLHFVRAASHVPIGSDGAPRATVIAPATAEALRQLDDLRAKDLITDEEYRSKRKASSTGCKPR